MLILGHLILVLAMWFNLELSPKYLVKKTHSCLNSKKGEHIEYVGFLNIATIE